MTDEMVKQVVLDKEIEMALTVAEKSCTYQNLLSLMEKFEVAITLTLEESKKHKVQGPKSEAQSIATKRYADEMLKKIDAVRMKAKRPHLDACTQIDGLVMPSQKALKKIIDAEKAKCNAYRTMMLAEQRKAEAAARKAQEEAERAAREIKEEELSFGDIKVTPAEVQIPIVPVKQVVGKVETSTGAAVSYRTVKVPHLVDITKVPAQYLLLNEKAVKAAIKNGVEFIPGIDIREEVDMRSV